MNPLAVVRRRKAAENFMVAVVVVLLMIDNIMNSGGERRCGCAIQEVGYARNAAGMRLN